MAGRMKSLLKEKDMVTLFVENSHPDMAHNFKLHYVTTFTEVVEKGPILERALIAKGLVKIYNPNKEKSSEDKSRYLNQNKNAINDGVTDAKHVQVTNTSQRPQDVSNQPSIPNAILVPQGAPHPPQ